MRHDRYDCDPGCPLEAALEVLGGKWKGLILYHLRDGTRRFNELRRLMPAITQRTLTRQLRELERDGIVTRTVHAEVPPRVEYALTPAGLALVPVLETLCAWSEAHLPAVAVRIRPAAPDGEEAAADTRP